MSYFRTSGTEAEQFFEFETQVSKINQRIEDLESDLEHKQTLFSKYLRDYGIQHSNSSGRNSTRLPIGDSPKELLSTLNSLYDDLQQMLSAVCFPFIFKLSFLIK